MILRQSKDRRAHTTSWAYGTPRSVGYQCLDEQASLDEDEERGMKRLTDFAKGRWAIRVPCIQDFFYKQNFFVWTTQIIILDLD